MNKVYRPGSKRPINDLTGQRFGKLTVLGLSDKVDKYNRVFWHCKCDCGGERDALGAYLREGKVRSCGCLNVSHHRSPGRQRDEVPLQKVEVDKSHFEDDWMFLAQGERNIARPIRTINGDWI